VAEKLKYRFPGQQIIEKTGQFNLWDSQKDVQGFIVGDFKLDNLYIFEEAGNLPDNEELFFQETPPIISSKEEYLKTANNLIYSLKSDQLQKVVFSRIQKVDFDESKVYDFFLQLTVAYPNAMVYLISSKHFGTWIGATPEILLSQTGKNTSTIALAGTKKVDDISDWGKKEIEEQFFVSQFITKKLTSNKLNIISKNGPFDFSAGPVKHLKTDITFQLKDHSIEQVIKILHPTPAVSGTPQLEAINHIESNELHKRELYSGIIGTIYPENSLVYVNLRCCQIFNGAAYLYLGGGFTKDSIPEHEWDETENKSKTLLNILQNL